MVGATQAMYDVLVRMVGTDDPGHLTEAVAYYMTHPGEDNDMRLAIVNAILDAQAVDAPLTDTVEELRLAFRKVRAALIGMVSETDPIMWPVLIQVVKTLKGPGDPDRGLMVNALQALIDTEGVVG